jgi:hypothetical protein
MLVYQHMLRGFLGVLICSFVAFARVHAQEVIVARETKQESAKPATPPPEEIPSEPPSETPKKSKSQEKKPSPKSLTLEQMRMAGARAAERLNNPTPSSAARPPEAESETPATEAPAVSASATPVKKQAREQKSASPRSTPRNSKPDSAGAVRPTMIESGRQEPSGTPLPKWQATGEQTPAP